MPINNQYKTLLSLKRIEHTSGKKVIDSYSSFNSKLITYILEGGDAVQICPEDEVGEMKIVKYVLNICTSCGEQKHISKFNSNGQCEKTINNFYNKVRKLFWHRYIKTKPKP